MCWECAFAFGSLRMFPRARWSPEPLPAIGRNLPLVADCLRRALLAMHLAPRFSSIGAIKPKDERRSDCRSSTPQTTHHNLAYKIPDCQFNRATLSHTYFAGKDSEAMHLAHCGDAAKTWKVGIWHAIYQPDEAPWFQGLARLRGGLNHDCYRAAPLFRPAFVIFSSLGCDLGLFDKGRGDPEA
jgi:hypothetical protein